MQFNSYAYLLALPVLVTLYWLLPRSLGKMFLLLVSLTFYVLWAGKYVLLLFLLAFCVFACTQAMVQSGEKKRRYFWVGVVLVLLALTSRVWVPRLAELLLTAQFRPAQFLVSFVAPLGISFYCFEAIGLLIDSKQGRLKDVRFSQVLFFLSFWPTVAAGPILRFRELIPQLAQDQSFDLKAALRGVDRIVLGLVQKNLLADSLSGWIAEGFAPQGIALNTTLDNWFLTLAFGLQVYFDFSSYSNIAIGVAQLLGLRLPENFRFPYHAKTPADFWARWHMSLSRWIRDYLFFPASVRFKNSVFMFSLSLIAVMALVGLWHGIGWGFLLWGTLHGCYLAGYRLWSERLLPRWPALEKWTAVSMQVVTLLAVFAAWVPFRAANCHLAWQMLRVMFTQYSFRISYQINFYLVTLLVAGVCPVEPALARWFARFNDWSTKTKLHQATNLYLARPLLYAFALLLFFAFDSSNTQFIYFQF